MAEFEFVPSADFSKVAKDLERLKNHPLMHDQNAQELHSTMTSLHDSMHQMIDVFKKASNEMALEEREDHLMKRHMQPVIEAINKIQDQNETIAQGLVQANDSIDELKDDVQRLFKQQGELLLQISEVNTHVKTKDIMQPPIQTPQAIPPSNFQGVPPLGSPGSPMPNPPAATPQGIPPLPKNGLAKPKKKGLFG